MLRFRLACWMPSLRKNRKENEKMRSTNQIRKIVIFFLILTMSVSVAGCKKKTAENPTDAKVADETAYGSYDIRLTSGQDEEISLLAPKVSEYLALDEKDTEAVAAFLYQADTSWYDKDLYCFSWSNAGAESYDVLFATNEDLSDAQVIETTDTQLCVSDCTFLLPGNTYYWKVIGTNEEGRGCFSETGSFTVKDEKLRSVFADGVENVRDMGGWQTADQKEHVKYGMIYRGGRLNRDLTTEKVYVTQDGIRTMREQLGIRSELDLRNGSDNDGQTECALGDDLLYELYPVAAYDRIIPGSKGYDRASAESVKAIFEYLADESHYPVYLHCNYGADRTGTVAFLINALLGVPYEDLVKDFELTSLTPSQGRWRSGIEKNDADGTYHFTKNGIMQSDDSNYVAFGRFHDTLMKKYGQKKTLSEAVEAYLTQACGVKGDTIRAVKKILLENN